MSAMERVFSNKEYCLEELSRIREIWGDKTKFTFKTSEAMRQTLAWMWLYCPEEVRTAVEAELNELDIRISYAVMASFWLPLIGE